MKKLRKITLYNNKTSVGDKIIRGYFPNLSEFEYNNDSV